MQLTVQEHTMTERVSTNSSFHSLLGFCCHEQQHHHLLAVLCTISIQGKEKSPTKLPLLAQKCPLHDISQRTFSFLFSERDCGTLLIYSMSCIINTHAAGVPQDYRQALSNTTQKSGHARALRRTPLPFPSSLTDTQHSRL